MLFIGYALAFSGCCQQQQKSAFCGENVHLSLERLISLFSAVLQHWFFQQLPAQQQGRVRAEIPPL